MWWPGSNNFQESLRKAGFELLHKTEKVVVLTSKCHTHKHTHTYMGSRCFGLIAGSLNPTVCSAPWFWWCHFREKKIGNNLADPSVSLTLFHNPFHFLPCPNIITQPQRGPFSRRWREMHCSLLHVRPANQGALLSLGAGIKRSQERKSFLPWGI